ncbi:hypothetical protein HDR67_02925, partial [bacterium]|nr:hypothetical protein [bacterium]
MKKKIIFLSIFILLLAIGGVGIYYFTQSNRKPVVWADEEAKFQTYTAPAPTDGTTPLDHDAYDNIAYVLWVLEHTKQYSSHTEGTSVSVGQTQVIYNHRRVNGDEQLVDTISGGLVSLGKQKYFLDNKVLIRDYISKKDDNIQWKTDEPECITKDAYIKRYGWLPNQASAYIICKDTILEISEVTLLDNGLYSITVSLNPDKDYAPFWYQREISTNSSSLTKPVFSSISLEYVFDANWRVQEINTKEKYKVTPKIAPILVDCATNIKETFNYDEYEFDTSAMEFFNQYKNLVPVGGETDIPEKNTPLTYITGSLLGGDTKEKTFDLTIQIQDRVIKGKLLLNISNLNNVVVKVSLGDLQVAYVDHEVFIDYGTIKIKCNIDEASVILEPLLEEILLDQNHTSSPSNTSLDLGQIMNDINAAVVTETENSVQLDLTLNLMGFDLPLIFNIARSVDEKGTETLELRSIQSNMKFAQNDISVQINQNSQVGFESLDGEYNDLNEIDFVIEDVTQLLKNKKFSMAFSASYDSYHFSGVVRVGLKENDPLQILLTIENEKENLKESLLITYQTGIFYVKYREINLKFTASEFSEFIKKYLPTPDELPNFEISQMVDWLLTLDIKAIFKEVTIKENEVFISLNLSSCLKDIEDFQLQIVDTEKGFSLKSNLYDIILELDATTDYTIEFDS